MKGINFQILILMIKNMKRGGTYEKKIGSLKEIDCMSYDNKGQKELFLKVLEQEKEYVSESYEPSVRDIEKLLNLVGMLFERCEYLENEIKDEALESRVYEIKGIKCIRCCKEIQENIIVRTINSKSRKEAFYCHGCWNIVDKKGVNNG